MGEFLFEEFNRTDEREIYSMQDLCDFAKESGAKVDIKWLGSLAITIFPINGKHWNLESYILASDSPSMDAAVRNVSFTTGNSGRSWYYRPWTNKSLIGTISPDGIYSLTDSRSAIDLNGEESGILRYTEGGEKE